MKPDGAAASAHDLNEEERFALKNARTIAVALIVGVVLFTGVVAGITNSGGGGGAAPVSPPSLANVPQHVLMIAGLAGLMLLSAIPAAIFTRKTMFARGVDESTGRVEPGAFVTGTIISLALLEGPALMALVSCIMGKSLWPGGAIALVAIIVMILMVPRASHFSPGGARGGDGGVYGYKDPEKWR